MGYVNATKMVSGVGKFCVLLSSEAPGHFLSRPPDHSVRIRGRARNFYDLSTYRTFSLVTLYPDRDCTPRPQSLLRRLLEGESNTEYSATSFEFSVADKETSGRRNRSLRARLRIYSPFSATPSTWSSDTCVDHSLLVTGTS